MVSPVIRLETTQSVAGLSARDAIAKLDRDGYSVGESLIWDCFSQ